MTPSTLVAVGVALLSLAAFLHSLCSDDDASMAEFGLVGMVGFSIVGAALMRAGGSSWTPGWVLVAASVLCFLTYCWNRGYR